MPRLSGLQVLAFELTGYGESIPQGVGRDISVGAQADRLLDWLDQLDIGPAVLVGHDLGGGVAHIAAVRRPDRCAGLLIMNGVGDDSWPVPSVKAMAVASPVLSRLPAVALKPALAILLARGHDDTLVLPARVVWGAADPFQKVEYGERFARDLRTPLRRIEGGKHFTPEDHPDVVADQVRSLADEVTTGRKASSTRRR